MEDYGFDPDSSSLHCWYFHEPRVSALLAGRRDTDVPRPLVRTPAGASTRTVTPAAIRALFDWIKTMRPLNLRDQVVGAELKSGYPFVLFDRFYCQGISDLAGTSDALQFGTIHTKLVAAGGRELSFRISKDHLTTRSAYAQLTGQPKLFAVGTIDKVDDQQITALPCVLGTLILIPNELPLSDGELDERTREVRLILCEYTTPAQQGYVEWYKKDEELRQKHPQSSASWRAERIARSGGKRKFSTSHVRKQIREVRKKLGKTD